MYLASYVLGQDCSERFRAQLNGETCTAYWLRNLGNENVPKFRPLNKVPSLILNIWALLCESLHGQSSQVSLINRDSVYQAVHTSTIKQDDITRGECCRYHRKWTRPYWNCSTISLMVISEQNSLTVSTNKIEAFLGNKVI